MDVSEWNEYAKIMLQYDLLEPVFASLWHVDMKNGQKYIQSKQGCCGTNQNISKKFLRAYPQLTDRSSPTRVAFPTTFTLSGALVAIICVAAELFKHHLVRNSNQLFRSNSVDPHG